MYDVLIIGGGVIGCAIARELSRYALRTIVLEASSDVANAGATKANSGIIHAGYDATPGTNKAKFNVLGNKMFAQIARELDVPFVQNGSLVVAFAGGDLAILQRLKTQGEQNGVKGLQILTREQLLAQEPNTNPGAIGALYAPTGGITSPYALCIAYAENAVTNGVEFAFHKKVNPIKKEGSFYSISTSDGSIYKSKTIVNAAGVYADTLHNQVSSKQFHILPRKGEYHMLDKTCAGLFYSTMFQVPGEKGKGVLITPTVDGPVLIGPTAEDIADKTATQTTKAGLATVLAQAQRTCPNIPQGAFITAFAGIRAHSDQNDFIVGECLDAPGFFNAAGIESPGLTAAPAIGMYIAKEVAKKLTAAPNTGFLPTQKSIPHFANLLNEERAALIAQDSSFGNIICRCEMVSEAQIRMAIRRPVGATTADGIKRRIRAGMGRCQGGFCLPKIIEILSEELCIPKTQVAKNEPNSAYLLSPISPTPKEVL